MLAHRVVVLPSLSPSRVVPVTRRLLTHHRGDPVLLYQVPRSSRDRPPSRQPAAPTELHEDYRFGLRSRRPPTLFCCGRSALVFASTVYPAQSPHYTYPINRPCSGTQTSFRPKSRPSSQLRPCRSHPRNPHACSHWEWCPNHGPRSSGLSST